MITKGRFAGAVLAGLVMVGCTDDQPKPTPSSPTVSPSPESPLPISPPVSPSFAGTLITIEVRGGKVITDQATVKVKRDESVQIDVTSDVADEVHVHGYDFKADVAAGGTVTVTLEATIPGTFEVELEKAHLTLVHLQVS